MPTLPLYDDGTHRALLLEDFSQGGMVQANHHLVVHGRSGIILDPGGHKVFARVLSEATSLLAGGKLETIFLSHQDPDIVAALNGWLMTTDATAFVSELWLRFIPHFGIDRLVLDRLKGIPDGGMWIDVAGARFGILPAHFLHSPGNFQLWDPVSRILYTGDLGASIGTEEREVKDFDAHLPHMTGFHRRYMASGRALRTWAAMARRLDVDILAPQHGALFRGPAMVSRFLDWADSFECGVDVLPDEWPLPPA